MPIESGPGGPNIARSVGQETGPQAPTGGVRQEGQVVTPDIAPPPTRKTKWKPWHRATAIAAGVALPVVGALSLLRPRDDTSSKKEQAPTSLVKPAIADTSVPTSVPETTTTTEAPKLSAFQSALKDASFPQATIDAYKEATSSAQIELENGMKVNFWVLGLDNISIDSEAAKKALDEIYKLPEKLQDGFDLPQKDGSNVTAKLSIPTEYKNRDFFIVKDGVDVPSRLLSSKGRNFGETYYDPKGGHTVINVANANSQGVNQIFMIESAQGLKISPDSQGNRETAFISIGRRYFLGDYSSMYRANNGQVNLGTAERPNIYPLLSPETVASMHIPKINPPVQIAA